MNRAPLISVVMSVYNGAAYLKECINSILSQTFSDFEFIIINDGSTDKTLEIIENYIKIDNRIVVISRENKGLIYSLNESIKKARGKYIARMDADDISLPKRFERQIEFLENNNLDICGTNMRAFSNGEDLNEVYYPSTHNDIKFSLLFSNAFAHPTMMIKRDIFQNLFYRSTACNSKGYHVEDYHVEDYQLWTDIALKGFKMGNINEVLFKYRLHNNQVSVVFTERQTAASAAVSISYLSRLEIKGESITCFSSFVENASIVAWNKLCKQLMIYAKQNKVSDKYFVKALRHILRNATKTNFIYFLIYRRWTRGIKKNFMGELYVLIQCFLFLNKKSRLFHFLKPFYLKLDLWKSFFSNIKFF